MMKRDEVIASIKVLKEKLKPQFGDDIDVQAMLFIIGVQELGKGRMKFSKDEKVEVMHVALCTLLEPFGYYLFKGRDEDGWPHWEPVGKLPFMRPAEQNMFMQEAIVLYFRKQGLID
jgi:hypothetical protein